ncbi:hypothetical protein [Natrarchaeobius oligotrophus]|uniref:FokI cleavage domain-containing protein n=1 Tax=Natrarchaeobius chitinivorans TaxID=1679083 RepID=A0A3N6PIX1_NATCH|nr:hypothetical protein [Natrarchaeobius chitinivorans]RQG98315.1 hypothetical protein EA472_18045 [Natrarchaeobius chitinivorans]
MVLADDQQLVRAWDAFEDNDYRMKDSQGEVVTMEEADQRREDRLPVLRELIDDFLAGDLPLSEFKSEIDGQNKRFPYWGFKGMNGMMFFNMVYSSAGEERQDELAELLHNLIQPPADQTEAKEKIRSLEGFVERLRNEVDDLRKAPRPGSIPYFLSYFWQVHAPDEYPIYYTSMVNALSDLAIWEPEDDLADSYASFWELNEELRKALGEHTGRDIHLWTVEHVFWYWQQRDEFDDEPEPAGGTTQMTTLPDSYIPPIVSILPDLAENTDEIQSVVDGIGHSVETLFENRLARAFRMVGFEVDEMGQGSGRNPDGIAKDHMHNYAIIYDAKSRRNGYSMGTGDERQFQDYINREVPSLRAQGFRNIYFAVISGDFTDDERDAIRTLKISTDIQEVRLIEVEALLILLENRLRDPSFGLGPGDLGGPGVQDFFAESGVLTAADVREELGV